MTAKQTKKPTPLTGECPNPNSPYTLWELIRELESNQVFADFFLGLIKRANNNEKGAIECVDSYLEPTTGELEGLGVPPSQVNSLKKCTESGLLVAAIAKQGAGQAPK